MMILQKLRCFGKVFLGLLDVDFDMMFCCLGVKVFFFGQDDFFVELVVSGREGFMGYVYFIYFIFSVEKVFVSLIFYRQKVIDVV